MMYDYVIVGGGSAGCVLASRLSEDADVQVLLLEAGGPDDRPELADPSAWWTLLGGDNDWGFRTVPQPHANGRSIPWPRGRVLGGSSSINALVYVRGLASDFDAWAAQGATGWDAAAMLRAFAELEDCAWGDPATRGTGGPLPILRPEEHNPLAVAAFAAAQELGHPVNEDVNAGTLDGVGYNQLTVRDGLRASAAAAFLRPVMTRPNLTVVTDATAQRLAVTSSGRVTEVVYRRSGSGDLHRAKVGGEAILCAGTIGSPQLLMVSGIGPGDHLRGLGIDVAVDLPGVGSNLHDHPGVGVTFAARRPVPYGPHQHSELALFTRSRPELAEPDLQWGLVQVPVVADGFPVPAQGFTFYPSYLKPRSRGRLRLVSADVHDAPAIDPNYLGDPADRDALVAAIEQSRALAAAPSLREWVGEEVAPGPAATGAAALARYVEQALDTWFHPVGTCRVGTDGDAVVDPQLRVGGTENLRVADASVMPEVTSGNTNAPTLAIAWRAAELIRGSL